MTEHHSHSKIPTLSKNCLLLIAVEASEGARQQEAGSFHSSHFLCLSPACCRRQDWLDALGCMAALSASFPVGPLCPTREHALLVMLVMNCCWEQINECVRNGSGTASQFLNTTVKKSQNNSDTNAQEL